MERHPTGTVITLALAHRKKKRGDFVDFEKVVSITEVGIRKDPKRIPGTPFLYEEPVISTRKHPDVHHSEGCWVNCVGVLMYTYSSASSNDPDGSEWRTMGGILSRICHVEQYGRIDRKAQGALRSRLVDAESSIRHERNPGTGQEKDASLGNAIELRWVNMLLYLPRTYFPGGFPVSYGGFLAPLQAKHISHRILSYP